MRCPRLNHFVRLNASGMIGKCGHMHRAPEFKNFEQMQSSPWLHSVKDKMDADSWPEECVRCMKTEEVGGRSVRLDMIQRDKILKAFNKDYLILGGVLDNVCNSACQTCNANLSSKIGSLTKNTIKVNNFKNIRNLPLDRIIELDINGGEPTYSANYKKLLQALPPNTKIVRINTNAHKPFDLLEGMLKKGVRVIMTVSFDGLDRIHDYVRWPVKFSQVETTLATYKKLQTKYPKLLRINLWTTVSVYNLHQFEAILDYAKKNDIEHSFGLLERPNVLSIEHANSLNIDSRKRLEASRKKVCKQLAEKVANKPKNSKQLIQFVKLQDSHRQIDFKDYFNFDPNLL